MGVVAGLGAAAAATSIGSSLYGMANSGGGGTGTYGGNPNVYVPYAQPQADTLYQGIFNSMAPYASSLPSQVIPQYQGYVSGIQQNPYAAESLGAATTSAAYAPTLYNMMTQNAGQISNAGNRILATGMDPQQALYNRLQQQTTDQSNAVNSMYGLGSSPYGAGVANQALSNFNIDWQNAQLQRQAQALQAAQGAYAGAGNLATSGLQGYDALMNLPSQTYLGQQQTGLGALNSLAGGYNTAFGPSESLANLLQSYLGLGQSATGLAQAGQAQQFGQNQTLGQNLSTALNSPSLQNGINNLFNGSSGTPFNPFDPSAGYMGTVGNYTPYYGPDQMASMIGFAGGV